MWQAVGERLSADAGGASVLLAAGILAGAVLRSGGKGQPTPEARKPGVWRQLAVTSASLVLLLAAGIEPVYTRLGPTVATLIQPLRSGNLSRLDHAALERGYYEGLMQVNRFNSQLWEVYSKRPANWLDIEGGALKRHVGGFAQMELIPSFVSSTSYGNISTNRWGMRDQDYERKRPEGAYRMAFMGPSSVMGWGVPDGATFEALLEKRLNRENTAVPFMSYEILNFGVPGYQPPQQLVAVEKALEFDPQTVWYIATTRELSRSANYLAEVVGKRIAIPYPELHGIALKAGLSPGMNETAALRRLAPFKTEILAVVYREFVEHCRKRGVTPVWILLPNVREDAWQDETPEMRRLAEAAGFVILDMTGVYRNTDVAAIRLAEWDEHPNARAHELIASRLYQEIQDKRDLLFPMKK
jgi:hypothetical protein